MFGVIVAVVVSNTVAVLLHTEGVYESELEAQLQVSYLAQQPPRTLRRLTAAQLMSSPAVGLPAVVPVHVAQGVLRSTAHNGFPVYDARCLDPLTGRYRLDGFVMRSQVELLLQQGVHCDQHGRYLHQPPDVPAFEQRVAAVMANRLQHHPSGGPAYFKELAEAAAAAERRRSSSEEQGPAPHADSGGSVTLDEVASPFEIQVRLSARQPAAAVPVGVLPPRHLAPDVQDVPPYLNLDPFLNQAPVTVRLATPAMRVHAMFVSLSLR